MKKLSKEEIRLKIERIFSSIPSINDIKKTKKLAMSKNISLADYKKIFCKKCLSYFNHLNMEIRIKKSFKITKCKNCGYLSRYKL